MIGARVVAFWSQIIEGAVEVMGIFKRITATILSASLIWSCSVNGAQAHATIPPSFFAHHVVSSKFFPFQTKTSSFLVSKQLSLLLGKGRNNVFLQSFNGPAGTSLAFRAFYNRDRQIVQNGVALGKSLVPQFSSGIVTNGGLVGSLYEQVGPTTYSQIYGQNNLFSAFGSSPLNVGGPASPGGPNPLPTNNFFTFSGTGTTTFMKSVSGKILVNSGTFVERPLSGSARALLNQESLLTSKSIGLGEKLAPPTFTGGSVLGGQFFATTYVNNGSAFIPVDKFVYAFGNNPLNANLGTITIANPGNYIDFANGTIKTISSAALYNTIYVTNPIAEHEGILFALGANALNTSPAPFIPTNFTSFIFF
jgi:hypothetical protein